MLDLLEERVQKTPPTRDYLSYSAIRTYQGCPLRYYFKYVVGLPEDVVAAGLLFGSGMHAALEAHFRGLMTGIPTRLDELLGVFWECWENRKARKILSGKEDADSIGDSAERMLKGFLQSELANPKGTVIGVEEELRGHVFHEMPDLLARLDLIVDTGEAIKVSDFKTSRSQWDEDQVANSADQLLLYSELLHPLADGRPVQMEFIVLTKTKTPQVNVHPVAHDWRQVNRTKQMVEHVWRAIQGGHFYPNPSFQCATCPFRTPCSQWQELH